MKNKITLSLILLINTLIFSQNKFELGTIHFKNGKTEKGYIQFSNGTINSDHIIYKKSLDDDTKNLTPSQAISIIFQETSRQITTDTIDGKEKFLEIIVKGKSNLLFLSEEKGNKRYFLRSDKSGLKELKVSEKVTSSKRFIFKEYIGVLNLDFNDCNEISDKINASRFQLKSLAKVFTIYNQCVNEIQFTSERLDRKAQHRLQLELGVYNTQTKSAGTADPSTFDNKTTPTVGINYIYTPTFFSSKVSLLTGISYFNIKTERELENNRLGQPNKIDITSINHQLGLLFNLGNTTKKLRPDLKIYYVGVIPLTNVESIYSKVNNNGEELAVFRESSLKKYGSGFGVELGLNYKISKGNEISLNIGYQRIADFILSFEESYPFNSFVIKFGYSINL